MKVTASKCSRTSGASGGSTKSKFSTRHTVCAAGVPAAPDGGSESDAPDGGATAIVTLSVALLPPAGWNGPDGVSGSVHVIEAPGGLPANGTIVGGASPVVLTIDASGRPSSVAPLSAWSIGTAPGTGPSRREMARAAYFGAINPPERSGRLVKSMPTPSGSSISRARSAASPLSM